MLKPELLPRLKQPVDMGWVNHPKVWYVGMRVEEALAYILKGEI